MNEKKEPHVCETNSVRCLPSKFLKTENNPIFAKSASTALHLGTSEWKSTARRIVSCSFRVCCSFSFIVRAEDERWITMREVPHSLVLFSVSKRVCEVVGRTSVMEINTTFSCWRRKVWNAPSGRRSINWVSECGACLGAMGY